jgi:hypothetical protein
MAHQHLVAHLAPGRGLVHVLVVRRWGDLQAVLGQHGTDRLNTTTQATGFAAVGVVADEVHDQRENAAHSGGAGRRKPKRCVTGAR